MGTKYNPLRKRVDTLNYKQDQFLLGTILFAVLVFLLPTSLMYYLYFSILLSVVSLIKKFLSLIVAVVEFIPVDEFLTTINHKYTKSPPTIDDIHFTTTQPIPFNECFQDYTMFFGKVCFSPQQH
ncbi:putative phosphatidylinositol n-acetylglucosaminyltransferase subunit q [Entamoeba marina]